MKNTTRILIIGAIAIFSSNINAQVGVGTTVPRGALEVSSTTQGIVPPQVALTDLTVQAPVVNPAGGVIPNGTLVWNTNTAGTIPNNVSPGMYYWLTNRWVSVAGSPGGLDWSIIGNGGIDGGTTGITGTPATQGVNFIGTYDVTNFDIRTQGLHAARVSSLGEFFIGGLETVLPGDLMNGISEGNALFPWAINGYTNQDGAGVYGRVSGGTTNFGAIQGEYEGTGTRGAGVRGILGSTLGGTATNDYPTAVHGDLFFNGGFFAARNFSFAISGNTFANSGRIVGGVYGLNFNNGTYGILGYERSNGANASVLGSTGYTNNTYRNNGENNINASVGLAIDGGYLGGHLKGNQIGLITKGNLIGQYTDGSIISNKGYAVINNDGTGNKTTTYVPTSTSIDVTTKGTGKLVNGEAFISFNNAYSKLISSNQPIIVTVSPMGESKGVYVTEVSNRGFKVKENSNGTANVNFYWIAVGEKKDSNLNVPKEMLTQNFDKNLDSYLTINEDAKGDNISKAMWWDGSNLKFGKIAPKEQGETDSSRLPKESRERKGKENYKPRKYMREGQKMPNQK